MQHWWQHHHHYFYKRSASALMVSGNQRRSQSFQIRGSFCSLRLSPFVNEPPGNCDEDCIKKERKKDEMKLRKIILLMKSGWTQLFLFPKDDRSVIIGNVTIKFFASLLIYCRQSISHDLIPWFLLSTLCIDCPN